MSDNVLELLEYACTILEKRATDKNREPAARIAYDSAICMIQYALTEQYECLAQFDY